jgi:hypothetical protein
MSGYTQTTNELLYAFYGAATTSLTTVTTAQSLTITYPAIIIPSGYMSNVGAHSSSLRFEMGGLLTATATIPTFTIGLALTSAQPPVFSATAPLVVSAAFTPAASTNQPFYMEVDIGLRTLGIGAASAVVAIGAFNCSTLTAAANTGAAPLPAVGALSPFATWETDLQYFLWPYLTLGTATTGNTLTVEFAKLYGEN